MSFLTDLFEGHGGKLGKDLSNPLDDAGKDFSKQPAWAKDLEIAAPLIAGTVLTAGADTPLLAGLGGIFGGAGAAADAGAAGIAGETVAGGADIFGDAGVLGETVAGADAVLPAGATLTSGTAPAAFADAFGGAGGVAGQTVADTGLATGAPVTNALDTAALDAPGAVGNAAGAPLSLSGGTTSTGGTAGSGSIWDTIGKGATSAFTKNPIGTTLGVAGVGGALYGGVEQKLAANKLNAQEQANVTNAANIASTAQSIAAPLINQGQTLTSYLSTGTLPPQFQSQVDQSIATQKAGIIQGYASRGQPTDPSKNSALQQELAAVDNSRAELMTQLESQLSTAGTNMINTANQMLAQGLAATQLESEIPIQMSKLNEQLNKDMMSSISNFAAAMNGGRNITSQAA